MISFIRMIDGQLLIGEVLNEKESDVVTIQNAVIINSFKVEELLSSCHKFEGMLNPFTNTEQSLSEIKKNHIISMHKDLDSSVEMAYNSYIKQWFNERELLSKLSKNINEEIELESDGNALSFEKIRKTSNTTIH